MTSLMIYTCWPFVIFCYINFMGGTKSETRNNRATKYTALIIPFSTKEHNQRLIVCPFTTAEEKKINHEISLGGNSLFTVDRQFGYWATNTHPQLDVCDKPIEPVIIYNLNKTRYEIGYELYIEEFVEETEFVLYKNYHDFVPVKSNNEVMNSTKPRSDSINEYKNGEYTIFMLDEEPYRTRIFHWKCELYFKSSGYSKITEGSLRSHEFKSYEPKIRNAYAGLDKNTTHLYSKLNLESSFEGVLRPASVPETRNKTLNSTPSYAELEISQIMPSWYFHDRWGWLASRSSMNIVPIWKPIANGRLKAVDSFLRKRELDLKDSHIKIIFGVNGVLKLPKKSNPNERQEMYLGHHSYRIPIPEIIFRVFSIQSGLAYGCSVAIIIHNTLSPVPDSERICDKKSQIATWNEIESRHFAEGLTYTCPLTTEVVEKLGGLEGFNFYSQPFEWPDNIEYVNEEDWLY